MSCRQARLVPDNCRTSWGLRPQYRTYAPVPLCFAIAPDIQHVRKDRDSGPNKHRTQEASGLFPLFSSEPRPYFRTPSSRNLARRPG